jgi:hypothetical protein
MMSSYKTTVMLEQYNKSEELLISVLFNSYNYLVDNHPAD